MDREADERSDEVRHVESLSEPLLLNEETWTGDGTSIFNHEQLMERVTVESPLLFRSICELLESAWRGVWIILFYSVLESSSSHGAYILPVFGCALLSGHFLGRCGRQIGSSRLYQVTFLLLSLTAAILVAHPRVGFYTKVLIAFLWWFLQGIYDAPNISQNSQRTQPFSKALIVVLGLILGFSIVTCLDKRPSLYRSSRDTRISLISSVAISLSTLSQFMAFMKGNRAIQSNLPLEPNESENSCVHRLFRCLQSLIAGLLSWHLLLQACVDRDDASSSRWNVCLLASMIASVLVRQCVPRCSRFSSAGFATVISASLLLLGIQSLYKNASQGRARVLCVVAWAAMTSYESLGDITFLFGSSRHLPSLDSEVSWVVGSALYSFFLRKASEERQSWYTVALGVIYSVISIFLFWTSCQAPKPRLPRDSVSIADGSSLNDSDDGSFYTCCSHVSESEDLQPQVDSMTNYVDGKCLTPRGRPSYINPGDRPDTVPPHYVTACRGNRDAATRMWINTQEWRYENEIWKIHTIPNPWYRRIKEAYPHFVHGFTKKGYPVVYEQAGRMKLKELFCEGMEVADMVQWYAFFMEALNNCICTSPELRRTRGLPADDLRGNSSSWGFAVVTDSAGVSLSAVSSPNVLSYLQRAGSVNTLHYPGSMKKCFVINANKVISVFWSGLRRAMPDSVHVDILSSSSYLDTLKEYIDEDQIPTEYGGRSPYPLGKHPFEKRLVSLIEKLDEPSMNSV